MDTKKFETYLIMDGWRLYPEGEDWIHAEKNIGLERYMIDFVLDQKHKSYKFHLKNALRFLASLKGITIIKLKEEINEL